jgi:hypothetical protein
MTTVTVTLNKERLLLWFGVAVLALLVITALSVELAPFGELLYTEVVCYQRIGPDVLGSCPYNQFLLPLF